MVKKIGNSVILISAFFLSGCATIVREDEVGVRDTFGNFAETPSGAGLKFFMWPVFDVTKVSVRTVNLEVASDLPSREGLTIGSDVSILYRVMPEKAPAVLAEVGPTYEKQVILPVFRSAIADVTSRFDAKDMHTGKRAEIEAEVKKQMAKILEPKGFHVESVLLKNIKLPAGLASAIEARLKAEQDAQRMVFVLEQEKREAERKLIEARGVRDAQKTISEGLSSQVLRFKAIEAMRDVAKSPNAKLIVTDGRQPLLFGPGEAPKTAID